MDVRLPFSEVSWPWRLLFIAALVGPVFVASNAALLSIEGIGGPVIVGAIYWALQRRRRLRGGAGWYPTEGEVGVLRWWDGQRWTQHRVVKETHPSQR